MKPKYYYLILLSGFISISCNDNAVEPLDSRESYYIIAFDHLRDIFIYNTLDHSLYNLTEGLVDTIYRASVSAFSHTGEELLFTLDYLKHGHEDLISSQRDDIFLHNVVSGKTLRITDNEYREINPIFSKDGDMIIYQSFENGNSDIFSMRKDGSNKKLIVGSAGNEWKPAFSYDGQRIFYVSIRDGDTDIYVNNIDGSHEINLTNSPLREGFPAISRNGDFIIYSAIESIINVGDFDKGLYKLDLFTLSKTQIVEGSNGVTGFSEPKLSIDSKYIAARYSDGSWLYIYLMDSDGKNPIELGKGVDVEFTQDGRYLIYQAHDGLHKVSISDKTNDLILAQPIWGYNIEVSTFKQ